MRALRPTAWLALCSWRRHAGATERFKTFAAQHAIGARRFRRRRCTAENGKLSRSRKGSFVFSRPGRVPLGIRQAVRADDRRRRPAPVDLRQGSEPGHGAQARPRARREPGGAARAAATKSRKATRSRPRAARRPRLARSRCRATPDTGFERIRLGFSASRARSDGAERPVRADDGDQVRDLQRNQDSPARASGSRRPKAPTSSVNDLFGKAEPAAPLAEALRPHRSTRSSARATSSGRASRCGSRSKSGKPHSMILWGPPGVGKTTLARLMAEDASTPSSSRSRRCSPACKDIREAVRAEAELAALRAPHDPLRRRGAPLQQGAAGRVPAASSSGGSSPSSARPPRTRRSR